MSEISCEWLPLVLDSSLPTSILFEPGGKDPTSRPFRLIRHPTDRSVDVRLCINTVSTKRRSLSPFIFLHLLPGESMSEIRLPVNCRLHSHWTTLWLGVRLVRSLLDHSAALFYNFACLLIQTSLECFRQWDHSQSLLLFTLNSSDDRQPTASECRIIFF